MNKTKPFVFNNQPCYIGTIVNIKEDFQQNFGFNTILKFIGYNSDENLYIFVALHNNWQTYKLSNEQIQMYVKDILEYCIIEQKSEHMDPKYIDGIVSAWIWYIIAMVFSLFLKGVGNVIFSLVVSTIVFFTWRHRKIMGG